MSCGGVCLAVQSYPGHIDPANVGRELPAFVKTIRSHGLRVTHIRAPEIENGSGRNLETIVAAAAQSGITHYSVGSYTYDLTKPMLPQLETIKASVERFVRLNEKHKITGVFEPGVKANSVGRVVWDLLYVMKGFDARYVGLSWDTGHMALHGDGMWEVLMRAAGPYVAVIAWTDREWRQDLGLLGEGGPYPGPVTRVGPLVTQPDGSAIPGELAPAGVGGQGSAGGRGSQPVDRNGVGLSGQDVEQRGETPAGNGRGGGRGRGGAGRGGPANPANSGSIDSDNPLYQSHNGEMPQRPMGGKVGRGNGWSASPVEMGTGIVDIYRTAAVLCEIEFTGPTELESQYKGIGGAENGATAITLPRQFVLGLLKREVLTIRKAFQNSGTGMSI
jgi:hypothetical protein